MINPELLTRAQWYAELSKIALDWEMDLITKSPYILDFAKVRIDRPPDFSEETLAYHDKQNKELFQHHWPQVKKLMASLESIGIYYLDPQLDNIKFPDL